MNSARRDRHVNIVAGVDATEIFMDADQLYMHVDCLRVGSWAGLPDPTTNGFLDMKNVHGKAGYSLTL